MVKHRFICGMTDSGKTFLATYLFARQKGISIFFNTAHALAPIKATKKAGGRVCNNMAEFEDALQTKIRRICYNPSELKTYALQELKYIKRLLFRVGRQINEHRDPPVIWCTLFVDEVYLLSNKTKPDEEIDTIWTAGRPKGIRAVGIAQRPAMTSHNILSQCDRHYIFKLKNWETPYFRKYGIKIEEFKTWLQKPYHYLLDDGDDVKYMRPLNP